ncbi:phage terminase large subunit-like protein [Rhodococcus percolatus]|uniref:terminase n=1 Tax=Rhodococcus opacus TaxID=37919 RepID=UPI001DD8F8DC|nr:terminase [Rhodococcus opacus]MBP2208174.1 phage terminase large subunit-like protein [Rhodococcus opacus]
MTGTTLQPSERKLSEVARHLIIPDGIVTSQFPRVYQRLQDVGVSFDRWQQGFGQISLGCRESGKYAASIGGVVASIPRQVGKTYTVGNLIIGMCLEFPGLRVIWTSHHNRTTTNTFRSMQSMVRRKKVWPHIAANGIRTANGEQEIRFANGSIIMFGAREQGFGRGMDAIDVEVFDEAQILGVKALEDMVPATNAAEHPHGGLVFFIGTPPRPTDDGEAFGSKRKKALDGLTRDQVYVEISADPDTDPDDQSKFGTFNPSYPHRTPLESMLRMRENIPDEDSWRREAMGIWPPDDDGEDEKVVDDGVWSSLYSGEPRFTGTTCLAVDMSPERESRDRTCSIVAAAKTTDGAHLQIGYHGSADTRTVVAYLKACIEAGDPVAIVIDPKSTAQVLEQPLRRAGIEPEMMRVSDVMASTTGFLTAVDESTISHDDDERMAAGLAAAKLREIGDGGGVAWARKTSGTICQVVAASNALWGLGQFEPKREIPQELAFEPTPSSESVMGDLMEVSW